MLRQFMNCSGSIRHSSCHRISTRMGDFRMGIEHLEKRAIEKEPAARLSSNEDLSLSNQELTELLRSRIEELNRRLAILNSGRTHCLTSARLTLCFCIQEQPGSRWGTRSAFVNLIFL